MRRGRKPGEIPQITIRNLQRTVPIDLGNLEKFACKALRLCLKIRLRKRADLTKLPRIFVLLISDRRMASLHRQFLGKSGPTDVLTFQHGEIFISTETARRHARRFGNSLAQELRLYVLHGLLHLRGFNDRNDIEAQEMQAIQRRILQKVSK
jgi:probable rRNA maturation factor